MRRRSCFPAPNSAMWRTVLLPFIFCLQVLADWSATSAPFPLAVRSPYLNSYINGTFGPEFQKQWPSLWNLDRGPQLARVLGWSGVARIDGSCYLLWGGGNVLNGVPVDSVEESRLSDVQLTATQSVLSITAGPMTVTVRILSPIEPQDLVLQSLPFAYVSVNASTTDNAPHSVQFYSDISLEWVSGNSSNIASWNTTKTSSTVFHAGSRQIQDPMTETSEMAEDSTVYYATTTGTRAATYQTGSDITLRGGFCQDGKLNNTADKNFRAISQSWPVLAHSVDFGEVQATPDDVFWGIGLVRDPIIDYGPSGNASQRARSSFFWTKYSFINDAIDAFMNDFSDAQQRATTLDDAISLDAKNVSDAYYDLVSRSARQAMALDYTVSKGSDGNWNKSDIMIFAKDVGTSRRVNPVESLYAALSSMLYLNETWLGYALEPLLRAQDGQGVGYAAPDLGYAYPIAAFDASKLNATRAIEDSGSMLIMGWAHAKFSHDTSQIQRYYTLYKEWADYLSANTSDLSGYADSDGEPKQNMANLALKGILGVRAMAEISAAVGNEGEHSTYLSKSTSMISSWKSQYTSSAADRHLVATAGNSTSWSLAYNLFGDRLLGFDLVDSDVYSAQDSVYSNSTSAFGLVYNSNAVVSKSHWTLLSAAATSTKNVRDILIELVDKKAASNQFSEIFPLTYNAAVGTGLSGFASPALGSMFSVICMNLYGSSSFSRTDSTGVNAGKFAGGVVGGLALISLGVFGLFLYRRRKSELRKQRQPESSTILLYDKDGNTTHNPGNHALLSPRPNRKREALTLTTEGYTVTSQSGEASSSNDPAPRDPTREAELEILRQEVEELRAREDIYNPPPEYHDDPEAERSLEPTPPPISPNEAANSSSPAAVTAGSSQ